MDIPYKSPAHAPGETGNQMVIQQFARYPAAFDTSLRSGSPGSGQSRLATSISPPLRRKETPRSVQSSPRGPLSGVIPRSGLRRGMSMSPPVLDTRQQQARTVSEEERRELPSRDVTDETIDDAYAGFILYCNPNVPSSTDTGELRKVFRLPPRSDGKSFSIFTLWQLIQKLDQKELKTWIQLAIGLGVEPPSVEKKQSTQKVQQYAVRLKRWMRAMHVDAFFEYCLGHFHIYYQQLPPANGPASESRDGVPLEEDLALRALVPEWKPKRGRKRAEDRENEETARMAKRPHIDTSVGLLDTNSLAAHAANFPQSAIPFSAFPDDMDGTDPWVAAASSFTSDGHGVDSLGGQELRWRPLDRDVSPAGYPRSAIIPRNHHADMLITSEPRSAVTPSSGERSRTRRRHGPVVSSAWPSNTGSATGRVRGRPPQRGSAPGGPFSSFPANPTRSSTPGDNGSIHSSPAVGIELAPASNQTSLSARPGARPNKLQLHVPQTSGRPIRLATPPTLLVNGITDMPTEGDAIDRRDSNTTSNDVDTDVVSIPSMTDRGQTGQGGAQISMSDVVRTVAGKILRAKLIGRSVAIEADEARGLAHVAVQRLRAIYSGIPSELLSVFCALYFGVSHRPGLGNIPSGSLTVKVVNGSAENSSLSVSSRGQTYTLLVDSRPVPGFGFSSLLSDLSLSPDSNLHLSRPGLDTVKESTETSDLLTDDDDFDNDVVGDHISAETWRQRYLRLRQQMRKRDAAVREYKRNILQSVMAGI